MDLTKTQNNSSGKKRKKSRKPQASTDRLTSTSCFDLNGEVYFTGAEEPLKFTRVTGRPSHAQWQQLLADRWNMKPPTLIISIIGSRAELSKRFKLTLKNGLWKAAESAGCCIISDGLDRGMTKIAGEAVRDYTEAYGGDHMVMVGVASSEQVAFCELFKANGTSKTKGKESKTTVYYPEPLSDEELDDNALSSTTSMNLPYWTERLTGDSQTKSVNSARQPTLTAQLSESEKDWKHEDTKHKFRLNSNHQYLLLVNNERHGLDDSRSNRYLETRILFERTIVTWAKPTNRSTTSSLSSKTAKISTKAASTEKKSGPGKQYSSQLETKIPRTSIALPSLENGLFDGTSRIFSKKSSTSHFEADGGAVTSKSVGRNGPVGGSLSAMVEATSNPEQPENYMSHESATETQTTKSDVIAKVPICGIVAGSGASLIEHVYASVTLNRCPMVIVRGTGGMADVIANVVDFMAFKNSFEENVITDEEIDMKIASIIHETRTEVQGQPQGGRARNKKFQARSKETGLAEKQNGPDGGARSTEATTQAVKPPVVNFKAYAHQVELLRDLTENYGHLLSVFDSEDTDLDGYMISALLSSAGLDTPRNELNLDQLEIAIRLNRADIARTKIFLEGKRWKRHGLDDFMFTVILNDQNDFVSLLLENGFNLEEFLTVHTLERLYTEFLKKTDYKSGLFQQLWKRARIYKMEWVMLRDIGRMIKNLVGDFYQPLYLSKKFRNTVVERGAHDSSDEDETDQGSSEVKVRARSYVLARPNESSSVTTSASSIPEDDEAVTLSASSDYPRANRAKNADSRRKTSTTSTKQSIKSNQTSDKSKPDGMRSHPVGTNDVKKLPNRASRTPNSGSTITSVSNNMVPKERQNSRSGKLTQDNADDDHATLKGTSDSASDAESDTTLIQHRPRKHRRTILTERLSRQSDQRTTESRPLSTGTQPYGRRCIVRPINGLNLGYQPYLGITNPIYNGEPLPGKSGRTPQMGRRRLVTITQNGQTVIMAPIAQAESTRNLSIVSSNKMNGSVSRVTSNHELNHSLRSETMAPTDERARESNVRHAVFADDLNQPLFQRPRSVSHFGLGRSAKPDHRPAMVQGTRRKSSSGARRVAHSILHPLTDPEKAQLQIREIERMARERRRDKERRHRHRVAQGKFTLMERLTGKAKEQRLEELKPAKLANFSHTSAVTFERPAREIMVLCILVGKLTMAEVFWAHEKEPIASALVASILFSELANKADDMTSKEEYDEAARSFEEKAERVLDECHQEDRVRTQLLLCRKLEFYGESSAIRLAARGRCIRFMAHPCCQELLSGIWMGELSPKCTWFQILSGIVVGLTFPVILPQIMRYTTIFGDTPPGSEQNMNADEPDIQNDVARKSLREQISMVRYSLATNRFKTPPSRWKIQIIRIKSFYRAPVTRFVYNTIFYLLFLLVFSWSLLNGLTLSISYFELLLVLMVVSLLSEELKQGFRSRSSIRDYINDGWNQLDVLAIGLFIIGFAIKIQAYRKIATHSEQAYNLMVQNRTQAILSSTNETFSSVLDTWWASTAWLYESGGNESVDRIDSISAMYGTWNFTEQLPPQTTNLISGDLINGTTGFAWNVDDPYFLLTNQPILISRIFYALSLFAFYVRLMYIFSFSMVLGPKLIMLNRMIVHDLLPFLLILLVCQIGYGIAVHSIAFADGYYADYEQSKMTINSTIKFKTGLESIYDAIIISYFQMFGLFRLNELEGESSKCRDENMCPQTSARRLSIVMLSAFVLLTQVLMFNLLVATFTSTYNEIEGSSQYFWCYQRYEMIQEFVDRPSVAPPFMLISYTIKLTGFIFGKLCNVILGREDEVDSDDDPFCRSIRENPALDRKLTKWEHMIGSRQTRVDAEGASGRKWTGGKRGDGHAIILRAGPGAGGGAAAVAAAKGAAGVGPGHAAGGDPTSLLQGIGPIFGPETEFIEDRFHELGNQLSRFVGIEERLSKMVQGANRLVQVVKQISQQQKQIMTSLIPNDGRRLVGRGTRGAHKSLLHEAVMNAVMGLGSHCTEIEEKIEEKIRIEEQCVKAVLTRTGAEEDEPDIVLEPKPGPPSRSVRGVPTTGRILERLIVSHRLWRIVPFNFEIYPGIRMNVPQAKTNWKTTYNEYRTFKITEDRLAIPYPGMDDENVNPAHVTFNSYDETSGVTR
ncbi:putative Transient receptor potential cation channel subfamily m member [Fasciola gigantica]|uniref:Putative Transient receptor potential cation channel subfamily m member n=1 Tax=Fasciola gigantica TaxID=46835 RepID=A0A504Z3T6_FASGI|nr:putative Transient receptor potential cation channel subfamily m member [Fasciola gigantica]